MTYMKVVVDGFKVPGRDHIKMAIGGAPISQMFADEIGADGYGADASNAVDLFLYLVGKGSAPVASAKPGVVVRTPTRPAAVQRPANATSKFQILYWQDLPSQVKAWDDFEEIKIDLPTPFVARIDAAAQRLGLTKGDEYIAQLRWGDEAERAGTPSEVAAAIQRELEEAAP
jgi:hypothetical protein